MILGEELIPSRPKLLTDSFGYKPKRITKIIKCFFVEKEIVENITFFFNTIEKKTTERGLLFDRKPTYCTTSLSIFKLKSLLLHQNYDEL